MSGSFLTQELPLPRLFERRVGGLLLPVSMEQTSVRERNRPSEEVDGACEIWEATGFPTWGDVEQWLKAKKERLPHKGECGNKPGRGLSTLNQRG